MAKKFNPEYSTADILGLYTLRSNDGDELKLRALASAIRQICNLENKVDIPKQYKAISKEVRTPFVRDSWHRITSSLVAKTPVIHIVPLNDKREDYRESANIAERFDLAMLEIFNKELSTDIVYDLAAKLVRDGESVLTVTHRPDLWSSFPTGTSLEAQEDYKKKHGLPIAWKAIDRFSIVYENGEYGDEWVIEYGEYPRSFLKSKYGMVEYDDKLKNPRNLYEGSPMPEGLLYSATGRAVKVQFFNSREWHVIIDGSPAPGFPKPNPYSPHLPYFKASAYEKESLLFSLLYLAPRLDELLTMKLNWSYLGAYPNPVIQDAPNSNTMMGIDAVGTTPEEGTSPQPFKWVPGKAIEVPLGKSFGFMSPPSVGKDLNELIVILKGLIDIAGIPSIMRGISASGDSGYLANQQLAAASMAYRIVSISAQRQLEKAFEFSHWLVSNVIRQPVYAIGWSDIDRRTQIKGRNAEQAWLCLSPDSSGTNKANLEKVGLVQVKYRPTLPTDDQARAMIALQLTNASKPLYSKRKALESLLQEEDPDGILKELMVEEFIENEPIRSTILAEALREAGITLPGASPTPSQTSGLVGPNGQPLPPGPGQVNPVPLAEQDVLGTPSVRGMNQPVVPGNTGGRAPGSYPGLPPRR